MDDDIFDENGALTARFLLARGFCCANGCKNCPYLPRHGGLDSRAPEDVDAHVPPREVPKDASV